MKHLIFKVNSQSLQRVDKFKPAAGSVGYLTASFEFDSEWSGTTKTAKCRAGAAVYDAVISSDGSCVIPWEVLTVDKEKQIFGKQDFYIYVEGVNGTKTITTNEVKIELNVQGAGSEQNAGDPTPSTYAQFVADVTAATKANADIATAQAWDAEASAESATASAASLRNDYSNALKGNASGAVIRLDDVSPVEHNPKVKVICPENVDPSTVKVTRCGKNLLNPNSGSSSGKGLTFTNNGDGSFTVKGTATAAASFGLTRLTANPMYLHKGVTYTQSVIVLSGSTNGVAVVPSVEDSNGNVIWNYFSNNQTKTPEMHYKFRGYEVYAENGKAVDLKFKVQLEVGDTATDFEAYKEPTEYTPNADGTIEGVTSLSPTMTLLTDTDNITIECEYNRDINKVIADIITQLAGG